MEEPMEEPAENEMEVSSDTASQTAPMNTSDGAALAESDLLGFAMPPSQETTETVSQDGTEDLLDFSTPQETLASSTELLDFCSAPTSMSTSPQGDTPTETHETEDLLGFTTTATTEEETAVVEQSQSSNSAAAVDGDLLDWMSSPAPAIIPEESPLEGLGDVVTNNEARTVEETTVVEIQAHSDEMLDIVSSEQTSESEPTDNETQGEKVEPDAAATDAANAPVSLPPDTLLDTSSGEAATTERSATDVDAIKLNAHSSEEPMVESEGTKSVDTKSGGERQEGKSDENQEPIVSGQLFNGDAAAQSEAPVESVTPAKLENVNASDEVPAGKNEQDAQATVETPKHSAEEAQHDSEKSSEDALEEVNMDEEDAHDIQKFHDDENEGMAEVALDTAEEKSPVIAASSGPPMLPESVVKKVQQVDPWQMEDNAATNQTTLTESSPPVDGEKPLGTTAEQPEPSPTVVDIPGAGKQESNGDCAEQDALLVELQSSLQDHMTRQAEAEDRARKAEARLKEVEQQLQAKKEAEADLEALKERMKTVVSDKAHLELELAKLRTARDEHERKEIVLSNRLNAAKKKEALKVDLAERLEDEVKELQSELAATKKKLAESEGSGQKAEKNLEETTSQMTERVRLAETALADERRLNEDRKKKMKAFIESKQDELRQGKLQNDELNAELEQTNRLLREQNSRWKQLHAQWVQSQTRNRELQRDLNRIKKDSDNMHKIGDKMEMKLSRSAQETEEHKNKRLTAKHELMTILRTLEGEREVSSKLRDSLKFTFTPKAISQQQLLKESLKDLDTELEKLSRRLGRPLPPTIDSPNLLTEDDETEGSSGDTDVVGEEGKDASLNRSELDSNHLISNLESETQRVSQYIMALTSSIERMHIVLDESGPNTCINALTSILLGGGPPQIGNTSQEERSSITRSSSRSTRYGQVPTS